MSPRKNPKSYQFPSLATSYTLTLSVKSEITNVKKMMTPCHRPIKNPGESSPVRTRGFGSAAHEDRSTTTPSAAAKTIGGRSGRRWGHSVRGSILMGDRFSRILTDPESLLR